jgi:hypothetical protein
MVVLNSIMAMQGIAHVTLLCSCCNLLNPIGGNSPADPCTMCPPGTYSANKGTEKCVSCPFGHTGPEGASSVDDCHPIDVCPAGTGENNSVSMLHVCFQVLHRDRFVIRLG